MPTVSDLNLQIPYMLQPSVCKTFPKNIAYKYVTWYVASEKNSIARPICESAVETQGRMKVRLERVKEDIHSLLNEKIPFVLRQFKHEKPERKSPIRTRPTPPPYSPRRDKYMSFQTKRLRRK